MNRGLSALHFEAIHLCPLNLGDEGLRVFHSFLDFIGFSFSQTATNRPQSCQVERVLMRSWQLRRSVDGETDCSYLRMSDAFQDTPLVLSKGQFTIKFNPKLECYNWQL